MANTITSENWKQFISKDDALSISRSPEQAALKRSGDLLGPKYTTTCWLAYIQHVQGKQAAIEAYNAHTEALETGEKAARNILRTAFLTAYAIGRERWETEHADILAGRRITGPVLRAIRTTMQFTQDELAVALKVNSRSVRAWEAEEELANTGVSSELWEMWRAWINKVIEQIPGIEPQDGDCLIMPYNSTKMTLRRAALILAGRKFNIEPLPLDRIAHREEAPDWREEPRPEYRSPQFFENYSTAIRTNIEENKIMLKALETLVKECRTKVPNVSQDMRSALVGGTLSVEDEMKTIDSMLSKARSAITKQSIAFYPPQKAASMLEDVSYEQYDIHGSLESMTVFVKNLLK